MSVLGQFQFRRDIASAWTSVNPILLDGELGLESDTDKFKIGDGVTAWNGLPYGGIKGDQGDTGRAIVDVQRTAGNGAAGTVDTYTITYSEAPLTSTFEVRNGADGITPTIALAATVVVSPNVAPSVADLDAGPNAEFRFSLPRAATLSVGPTTTVNPAVAPSVARATNAAGDVTDTFSLPRAATLSVAPTNTVTPATNPSVSRATNAAGDVTDTFNLPRARNVAAGTTTTGNPGTNATVQSAQNGDGDVTLNFTIPRGDVGQTGPAANAFTNIAVPTQDTVSAEVANDTLTLVGAGSVSIATNAATDTITITGVATPPQNTFAVVTGNTGTATADAPSDTLAITGGTGISTAATDTPDGLVITNTDTGSAARTAHEAAADPHPQYLTQAEADVLYQPAGQSAGPQMASSVHAATQANNTTTAQDLTGQVFTIPPGRTARIQGNLIFTAAATTTGAFYGFRVSHGAGANGNVQGSWNAEVSLTSAAAATGLADGDSINVAGGATVASGILGTASVAGNNSAWIMLTVVNRSTNANATVALQFRSEVANSAVTAQIGTSAVALIG